MKALEVSIDGMVIGVFVPPDGQPFSAMIANVPKTYMRAQILASMTLSVGSGSFLMCKKVKLSHFE